MGIRMHKNDLAGSLSWVGTGFLCLCISVVLSPNARSEDLKGRWYFGGNLAFLSTTDDIRSNAAIFLGNFGDDGIPGTADPNETLSCSENGAFCDPRPDDTLARRSTIEETFKYDLTAGFGLTSWLSLQLDVSHFRGDVGPVDFYITDAYPFSTGSGYSVAKKELGIPTLAGQVTEIPVSLTAVVRFRKDSTINPYIGIGAGVIFAEVKVGPDVERLNARLASMRIKDKRNEFNQSFVIAAEQPFQTSGKVPVGENSLSVDVDDAFEYHLTGGGEYFFNDRTSLVFDARYTFADQDLRILLGSQDQVNFTIFSEGLFRGDGSVKYFAASGGQPSPLCSDSPNAPLYEVGLGVALGCAGTRVGGVGPLIRLPVYGPSDTVRCPENTVGDFDGDGVRNNDPDLCYNGNIFTNNPSGSQEPVGTAVVQGGTIDLTGFSVAVGLRFHF